MNPSAKQKDHFDSYQRPKPPQQINSCVNKLQWHEILFLCNLIKRPCLGTSKDYMHPIPLYQSELSYLRYHTREEMALVASSSITLGYIFIFHFYQKLRIMFVLSVGEETLPLYFVAFQVVLLLSSQNFISANYCFLLRILYFCLVIKLFACVVEFFMRGFFVY